VLVAPTQGEADRSAAPGRLMMLAIRTGRFQPLLPPDEAVRHPDLPTAMRVPSNRIVGDPAGVVARLEQLVAETGADELMVSTVAHSLDERIGSLELLASAWGNMAGWRASRS